MYTLKFHQPRTDFTGSDTFSYVVFDGKGKTDEGKVRVNIQTGQQGKEQTTTKPQEDRQHDQAQEHGSTIQQRQINPQINNPPSIYRWYRHHDGLY